jgi:hypothetical protein
LLTPTCALTRVCGSGIAVRWVRWENFGTFSDPVVRETVNRRSRVVANPEDGTDPFGSAEQMYHRESDVPEKVNPQRIRKKLVQ